MDSYSNTSSQTTQTTNTSDSSYPILFQLKSVADKSSASTNTGLASPYARRKSHVQTQTLKRVRISLALLGILGIVIVIFILSFYLPVAQRTIKRDDFNRSNKINVGSLEFDLSTAGIMLNNSFANTTLTIQTNFSKRGSAPFLVKQSNVNVLLKTEGALFSISLQSNHENIKCWNLTTTQNISTKTGHCVSFGNGSWFGIGERFYQTWLLNDANIEMVPFTTYDIKQGKVNKSYGGVIEPYFVSSLGFGILVDRRVPLRMSINNPVNGRLCFEMPLSSYYQRSNVVVTNTLQYTLCMGENIREVHKFFVGNFFKSPHKTPDLRMLISPVWSTWARYKSNITQEKILEFANEIVNNSMPASQLEIDDKYSTSYGDFDFDSSKFTNPKQMIQNLHSMGMRVTIWVYPFANLHSKAFKEGIDYWVKSGSTPGFVIWWNGLGGVLDMTNAKGVSWFKKRLNEFESQLGLDGFKFDAGEVRYLPELYNFHQPLENLNFFSTKYVEMASTFGGLGEARVGYGNQNCSIFTRILDRSSTWGIDNGLKSVLTATMTFGLLGYPFVLPDMVGGNAYSGKPDKELFIRWAQLNAFLPSIQFSLAPWDYDAETVTYIKAALDVRNKIAPDIQNFAKIAANTSYPIVRPLWWQAPDDPNAIIVDSQFLIGDKYLVAPVFEKGAQQRSVYLISGRWQEMFGEKRTFSVGSGGKRIVYKVGLSDILYFKNLDHKESNFCIKC